MKKQVMMLGLFLFVLLVAVGCFGGADAETLRCTFDEEEQGLTMSGEYVVEFENDKPIKVSINMTNQFESEEEAEMYYSFTEEMDDDMYDEEGVEVTTSLDGDKIITTIVVDSRKTADGDLEEEFFGLTADDEPLTRASMRAELETEGFICN